MAAKWAYVTTLPEHARSVTSMYSVSDTLRARIKDVKSSCYIRGILDNGSQRTFIKEDFSRKMSLNMLGDTDLTVNVLGNKGEGRSTRQRLVEVTL